MGLSFGTSCRLHVILRTVPLLECPLIPLHFDGANDPKPNVSFDTPSFFGVLVAAPDLTCPSTSQLLRSISLVLARASIATISKLLPSFGCSGGDYTSSCPPSLTYRIPQDLHPCLPDPGFTMDRLPGDAIGIYTEFLWFSGVRIPFSTFLLSVLKYFKDVCMDDGPASLKKWKDKYLLIDRRAIPDYLTWRHSCSCVFNDLPTDGYDQNDVERLRAHLICLREMREGVLVRSGLSSVWFNKEYRVPSHTTALAAQGAMIPLPTADEIVACRPDPRLAKKSKGLSQAGVRSSLDNEPERSRQLKRRKLRKRASKHGSSALELGQTEGVDEADLTDLCSEIENSLERDEGTSTKAASALAPHLGKRSGAPPSVDDASASGPSHVGTSVHASTSRRNLSLGGAVVSGHVGKSEAEVLRR
ncbi:hypothetical protein Tco_0624676 [Tanacetum coccineum]|uniref:Aminotransferase-like plant mobile domain-containing protein n=1 Tax=Tanacetum coccineum TaxID=301880 RepID=A0ABQ4WET2_9ASTR